MTRVHVALSCLLLASICVSVVMVARRIARPAAPLPDLSRLDSATAADLAALRDGLDEASGDSWLELADAWSAYGYFAEADLAYARAAALPAGKRGAGYLHVMWAICLEHMGRMNDAVAQFQAALPDTREPETSFCWYGIGKCDLRLEQPERAEEAFRNASASPQARYQLAKLLVRSERFAEAQPLLDELIESRPQAEEPHSLAARAAQLQDDNEAAGRYQDRALQAVEKFLVDSDRNVRREIRERYGIARILGQSAQSVARGDYRTVVQLLEESQGIEWAPTAALPLAEAYLRLDRPDDALRVLQEYSDRVGQSAHSEGLLGDTYQRLGDEDRARHAWKRSVGIVPNATLLDLLATMDERGGDATSAAGHRSLARLAEGAEAFRQDDLPRAQRALEEAVRLDPQVDHAWYYLGEVHRLSDRPAEARQCYDRCLEINPDHGRALASRARLPAE